jgi:hypothetical protein
VIAESKAKKANAKKHTKRLKNAKREGFDAAE